MTWIGGTKRAVSEEKPLQGEDGGKGSSHKRQCQESASVGGGTAIKGDTTPHLGSHRKDLFPTSSMKKTPPSGLGLVFRCLACDKEACPFENGYTVMNDGKEYNDHEHDPSEPSNQRGWTSKRKQISFDSMVNPVRTVVLRIMHSNGFWSSNKFIGNEKLDHKLRCWMKKKLEPRTVDENWHALRRAVKEALRFKRQQSVEAIRRLYQRELP